MAKEVKLKDIGSERALLATIIKNGKDVFIDADSIVDSTDFSLPLNRAIYTAIKQLSEDPNFGDKFDTESIKLKLKAIGLGDYVSTPKDIEYIELLDCASFDKSNVQMFAYQIKKFAIVRELHDKYKAATDYLANINGSEPLSEIISKAEGNVVDYITGVDGSNSLEPIYNNIVNKVEELIEKEPVNQVGISTGFPIFDEAIGGGIRRGTITMIGGRAKSAKSYHAMNIAHKISKNVKIPVLYLDSELTASYQQSRLICIESKCPIVKFETGQFKYSKDLVESVRASVRTINDFKLDYQSIAGLNHSEIISIMKRWLVKKVGFREDGKANDCVIIFDYLKLMDSAGLSKVTPEYILLGLMITELQNFAVKYDVPIISYIQLNRSGIDTEDQSVASGSDRLIWICSSFTILKNKDENDTALNCGFDKGNKKLIVVASRQGAGLEKDGDYINIHSSLKPGVSSSEGCGFMREGLRFSDSCGNMENVGQSKINKN